LSIVEQLPEEPQTEAPANDDNTQTTEVIQEIDLKELYPPSKWDSRIMMLLATIVPLVGLVAAIIVSWQYGWMGWPFLAMLIGFCALTELGITVGFHRLLTHRSFETYRPIRGFFTILGCLAVEGTPLYWCAVHRKHHQKSDQLGDPHSPHLHGSGIWGWLKGFWHAHTGWLFTTSWSEPDPERYVPEMVKDPVVRFVDRFYFLWVVISLAGPALLGWWITGTGLGAWLGFLWGGLVRVLLCHHITWSINSICHVWGKREFETPDLSRNNLIMGVLAVGEGWHNNHHAFPSSARHGLKWWQFDLSWIVIRTLELMRLAWNVRLPSKEAMDAKRRK